MIYPKTGLQKWSSIFDIENGNFKLGSGDILKKPEKMKRK